MTNGSLSHAGSTKVATESAIAQFDVIRNSVRVSSATFLMSHPHKAIVKAGIEKNEKDTGAGLLHFPKQLPTMNIPKLDVGQAWAPSGVFSFFNFLAPKDEPESQGIEKHSGCTDHVNTLPSQPHSPQDRKS
eukprot:14042_2